MFKFILTSDPHRCLIFQLPPANCRNSLQDTNSYQLAYQIGCIFITFTNLLPVAFHTIAIVLENALRFDLLYAFFQILLF